MNTAVFSGSPDKSIRPWPSPVSRQVCLYRPARRATSPAAEGFAEHLAQWMREWQQRRGGAAKTRRPSRR